MTKFRNLLILTATFFVLCTSNCQNLKTKKMKDLQDGLYIKMHTTMGEMLIEFYPEKTPLTVANFIGLAEGKIENNAKKLGEPFYDGLIFHRVISGFMIQGGDPSGNGTGGPGYQFGDEFDASLTHDGKGVLSMANSGPNTNGSQFFITELATPWLDGKHTVFGKVIDGMIVVDEIVKVKKGPSDKPLEDIKITKIEVIRKGEKYKNYDAKTEFDKAKANYDAKIKEKSAKADKELEDKIMSLEAGYQITESGLRYKYVTSKKEGKKVSRESDVSFLYEFADEDSQVLASNFGKIPEKVNLSKVNFLKGLEEALLMAKEGETLELLLLPRLAFGTNGQPGMGVKPNTILKTKIEIVEVK